MKLKSLPSTLSSHSHSFAPWDSNYNASSSSSSVHRHRHCVNFIVAAKSKKKHLHDSQGSNPQSSPPRITSNAKQNLRFLKTWKEYQKRKNTTPRPSTSYRKKKAEKTDTVHHEDHDPTSSLYNTNEFGIIDNAVPVLLVDGYNVCGYWMKLKKHFMSGNLEIARQMLIDELKTFSMLREVKVVVVFDAMMSGFPNHKENASGIDVVFSSETSADTWIEKEVSALKEDGCPTVWVVTSDRSQQEAANGVGAFVWSCKTLVTEINESQKEVDEMLQDQRSTFKVSLLKHNLKTEVVDALKNLRQKLAEKESK